MVAQNGEKKDHLQKCCMGLHEQTISQYRVVLRRDEAVELIAEFLGPRKTVDRSFRPPPWSGRGR